jgi:hypothetical protein
MSAIVKIDSLNKALIVKAKIYFYGKYAENELGEKIIKEITDFWNAPKTQIEIDGIPYKVMFEISQECMTISQVVEIMAVNTNYEINFVRIEDQNVSERSMMGFGLGDNSGHWIITDKLGESTTAAHEFGHAFGLPHPDQIDYRNTGLPPIMAPRGTIVDAIYQWNPLADAGMPGGTMMPAHRRVRTEEVLEVIAGRNYLDPNTSKIGKITNYFFDEIGQVANPIA